ncbi:ATP-grasp domain-containing protein [Kitasatospora sp. NPDC058201]|uniref:ATP-grasp domain-containing protein n=1 Tax=unclassified Kitasatospora TaxID=2633591 RepID=UPI003656FF26
MPAAPSSAPSAAPAAAHVVVLHRWTDSYADYAAYLDHTAYRVSYVTTPGGRAGIPASASAAVAVVPSTEDRAAVRAAVDRLTAEHGAPARIVALHEVDLDVAAELREELGVPGETPARLRPFRDKLAMARRLAAQGVPVPATGPAPDRAAVAGFADRHGWPVILKPVRGTASSHVTRLDGPEDLAAYAFPPDVAVLVQSYVPHEILHVDGVAADGDLRVWRASRYLNTCLDFTRGDALGSAEIDDPALLKAVGEFTRRAVLAMSAEPWVFHLELFASADGSEPEFHVLEVGARPGGAEVPFVWREVHGVDLMAAAVDIQLGRPLPAFPFPADRAEDGHEGDHEGDDEGEYGGWLLVPTPAARPCRVLAATPQTGLEDGPYAERLPAPGRHLADLPGYEHSGARFRFRGRTTADVERAIRRTVDRLDYRCEPVDPARPPHVVLVGTGGRVYREYALRDAAAHGRVSTVNDAPADWELPYLAGHLVADTGDADALTRAVAEALAGDTGPVGLLTWSEVQLERTAEAAERLGLPHMSPEAVRNCRDKLRTRRLLEQAGLPSARYAVAHGLDEALAAAESIGYPVVVKPRALAGSSGVVLAASPTALTELHRHADRAAFTGLDPLDGLLIEEYLDGPEISLDCVVVAGEVHAVNLARKRIGYPPFFEEVGHLVAPWHHEPWAGETTDLVARIHAALGVTTGVTHAELRLTARGPRLVELNGRLGGDFIPLLGRLATGVDLTAAALDTALGLVPDLRPVRDDCAEVRFLYPAQDGTVARLDVSGAREVPGVERVVALAEPGQRLLLPPRGVVPRLAAVVATGPDAATCDRVLNEAFSRIEATITPAEEA